MNKIITFCSYVILTFLVSQLHALQFNSEEPAPLISVHHAQKPALEEALSFFDMQDAVIRFHKIDLHERMKNFDAFKEGDEILLNLFDDVSYIAKVGRTGINVNGSVSVTARVKETAGYFILVTTGKRSLGSVYLPQENMYYKIISDPGTFDHYLIEMDARDRDILEGAPPVIPDMSEEDLPEQKGVYEQQAKKAGDPDELVNIDIMVLYTNNARTWADGNGGIENVVALAMANAQLVLDNSETMMTMRLVHSSLYAFQESSETGNDLGHYATSDVIHGLRNEYAADLVAVLARVNDVGGIAYLLNKKAGNPSTGFSVTRVQQATTSYTLIHEMGHNMGCHHHRDQNFQPGPTEWDDWDGNWWSAGWRWQGSDENHYCSVMTYTSGNYFDDGITHTEVPYFSNPNILFYDTPTGHPSFGDNAHTLREIKHVIGDYRTSSLASVFTEPASEIDFLTAVSGGYIADDAGEEIIQRGVVWDTEPNPTVEEHGGMTIDGAGIGKFTSVLEGLTPTTPYFVVAYARSENMTTYGSQRVFNTLTATSASVSTEEASLVTHNSAISGGDVFQGGNTEVSQRGLVWDTNPNPTILSNIGITEAGTGTGTFTSKITGLKPETEYFYRAYAANLAGTSYGRQQSFMTLHARIYPNPIIDKLYVEFYNESLERVDIVLTNTRGEVVKRKSINNHGDVQEILNVSHLAGGLYILSIESEFPFPVWQLFKSYQ
jgi:hypothetical protein